MSLFEQIAEIAKPNHLKLLDTILHEIDKGFNYSISFMGKSYHSEDGQLWGTNTIEISKSKTSICIRLKKCTDVHDFKSIALIRSIEDLKKTLKDLSTDYFDFFSNFGKATIYK